MNTFNQFSPHILVLVLLIVFSSAAAQDAESAPDMIVLKQSETTTTIEHQALRLEYESSLPAERRSQERAAQARRKAELAKAKSDGIKDALKYRNRAVEQMQRDNVIVVPDSQIDTSNWHAENETLFVKNFSTLVPIGFPSIDFSKTPLKHSEFLGTLGFPEEDGFAHQLTHMFIHKDYGRIVIEEFSFASSKQTSSFSVSRFMNNIDIHGLPAEYTVVRGRKSGRGRTNLEFYTDSVIYQITVYNALMSDQDRAFLRRLGRSLL